MSDTKMLQAIASSIALMRQEVKDGFKDVNNKMDKGFKDVNKRIDRLGNDLAYLEDDAPTRDEHDKLEKRVTKLEHKVILATYEQ
jgi:BMFP domain-containing protein YqiC